ncbi:hypothetical protein PEC301937_35620 [Pectobacterium carotovorum subsp. carotovorum]|nr:hypothetical protein PEC301937_35620 [Pectobacterium carotovorum subsp. carotovorum]
MLLSNYTESLSPVIYMSLDAVSINFLSFFPSRIQVQ